MNNHLIMNILDLLETLGENKVNNILSEFSCPKNPEIENFLLKNAIEFAKRKMSITYLVFNDKGDFFGYFTLTHKAAVISSEVLSKTSQRKISMHAKLDESTGSYDVSAFLIAQFGKNFSVDKENQISGNRLMEDVISILNDVQRLVGGGIVFLECEQNDKLLNFYQNEHNRFKVYGKRNSENENKMYLQLMRMF